MSDPADAAPPSPGANNHRRSDPELYRIAYIESQRALDDQRDELNGLRQRATAYIALVGSATAFLVGTAVKGATRDATFHTLVVLASVASVVALLATALILVPRDWEFRLSAQTLIDRWIEPDVPGPTEAGLLRGLAHRYDRMQVANETALKKLRVQYLILVSGGSVGVLLWALLAILKA